jgi:hypothetical protein
MPRQASLSDEGRDSRPATDRQDKAMFTHPRLTSQLAREHHRQMLAGASRRQLRRRHGRQATRNAGGAGKVIRRVAAAIAGAGIAALPSSTTEHYLSRWRQWGYPSAGLTPQRHCPGAEGSAASQRT